MSSAFAGLEGCVIAAINLSAALFSPDLAADVNAMLFFCFSLGTLLAPSIVRITGLKNALVGSMGIYNVYLLPFIWAMRGWLLFGAALGGLAGSVLWTAQGVYFTRNAVAYAEAAAPTPELLSKLTGETRAISVFAGFFAVIFQLVITLCKPFAATMLTVFPDDRARLFSSFIVLAALCTVAMTRIRTFAGDSHRGEGEGHPAKVRASAVPGLRAALERHAARLTARADAVPQLRTARLTLVRAAQRCPVRPGYPALLRVACDRRMLLLTVYNIAYGLSTAFFPSHVTVLTKQSLQQPCLETPPWAVGNATAANATAANATAAAPGAVCAGGAAAVGWMYALAGLSSVVIAATFAWGSDRFLWGRTAALALGSVGFGVPCRLMLAAAQLASDDGRLPLGMLFACFICYGGGVAAWQGSAMALVGDLFRSVEDEHRAAFAYLKLTSGMASTLGFMNFRRMGLPASAAITLLANACGLAAIGTLAVLDFVAAPAQPIPLMTTHKDVQATRAAAAGHGGPVTQIEGRVTALEGRVTAIELRGATEGAGETLRSTPTTAGKPTPFLATPRLMQDDWEEL
jgi:hypothetical protein